jgi:hypothetical protein
LNRRKDKNSLLVGHSPFRALGAATHESDGGSSDPTAAWIGDGSVDGAGRRLGNDRGDTNRQEIENGAHKGGASTHR